MISNHAADRLLDHLLGTKDIKFQRMYLGLYNGHPARGSGMEVDDPGYERKPITFAPAQAGVAKSAVEVVFPMANAAWGTITHFGVFDAKRNPYYFGELTSHATPANNQSIRFPVGYIHVVIDQLAPTDISDIEVWLDAFDGTTMWTDTAGTSPVLVDGSSVAAWDSKVGSVTFTERVEQGVMESKGGFDVTSAGSITAPYTNASTEWTLFAKVDETTTGTDTIVAHSDDGPLSFGSDINAAGPGINANGDKRNAGPTAQTGEKIIVWRVNPTTELFVNLGFDESGGTVTAFSSLDMDGDLIVGSNANSWSPLDLGSSLEAWWDPSDSSTVTLDGSNVEQIDDKSGNGNHLTRVGDGPTMGTINGLDAVLSANSASHYLTASPTTSSSDSVFSVGDNASSDTTWIFMAGDNPTEYLGAAQNGSGAAPYNACGTPNLWVDGVQLVSPTRDTWHDAITDEHVLSADSIDASGWDEVNPYYYAGGGGFQFTGLWGETVWVTGTLSSTDRERLEGYLAHKWSTDDELDGGHTYSGSPPGSFGGDPFTGVVKEVILYDRVLSDDEVERVIESMTSRESHPSQLVGTNVWNWSIINLGANDGASVTSVRDSSALRNDLVTNSFTYTEGSGLSGYMETDHAITLTSGFTFMAVANVTNKTVDTGLLQSSSNFASADNSVLDIAFDADGNLVHTSNRSGTLSANKSRQTIPTGEDVLITVHVPDATTGLVRLNGQNVGDDASGTDYLPDSAQPARVGRGYGVDLDGYIKDVVVAGPELTVSEQNQLEAAMMNLWGISRPFSHVVAGISNQSDPIIYGNHTQGYDDQTIGNYYDDAVLANVDIEDVVCHYSFGTIKGTAPDEVTSATLYVWLDAQDVSTLWEEDAATTQASDNSEVNRWDNKASGSAIARFRNLTDGATNSDIEYLTDGFWGLPTVLFKDTGQAYLYANTATSDAATNITIVWVGENNGTEDDHQYLVAKQAAGLGVWAAPERASGSGPGFFDGSHKDFGYEVTIGEPDIWIWEYDDNVARFYNRKTQLGSDTAQTDFGTTSNGLAIPDPSVSDLSISEICIYNGVLSQEERESLVDYLVAKWQLPGHGVPQVLLSEKLVNHFDFSDPSVCFTDTAMTTNVSSDSDNLQAVRDKGRGGTVISEGTNYPVWRTAANGINGVPAAEFDGANDYLSGHFNNRDLTGDWTVIAVMEPDGTEGVLLDNTNDAPQITINFSGSGGYVRFHADSNLNSTGHPSNAAWILECILSNSGDDSVIEDNGTPDTGNAGSGNFGGSDIYIGADTGAGTTFGGLIGEIIILEGELSTDERVSIYNYLNQKWRF